MSTTTQPPKPKRRWCQFSLKTLLVVMLMLIFSVTVGWIGSSVLHRRYATADFNALLDGSEGVELTLFKTDYQQRRVICTDEEVLAYLASMLRQSSGRNGNIGASYDFTFRFSTGRQCTVRCYLITTSRLSFFVPPSHEITLQSPIPDRVREIMNFLDAPWEEVAGLVQFVENGYPIRYEYDRRLHGAHPPGTRVSTLASNVED